MTCGCHGLSLVNTAKREIALLNIDIYGLALNSNVQVGNGLLMDEFIGKSSSMRYVREAVQE